MQKAKIKDWKITVTMNGSFRLEGIVVDHPKMTKSQYNVPATTSNLESIDFEKKIAITKNTEYELL